MLVETTASPSTVHLMASVSSLWLLAGVDPEKYGVTAPIIEFLQPMPRPGLISWSMAFIHSTLGIWEAKWQ